MYIEADLSVEIFINYVNAQGVEYPGNTVSERKILNANGYRLFYAVIAKSTNIKTFKISVSTKLSKQQILHISQHLQILHKEINQ